MPFRWKRALNLMKIFIPSAARFAYNRDFSVVYGALVRAGPTFIKLGQWASQRPDMFSDECIQTLYPLLDHVSFHDSEYSLLKIAEIERDVRFSEFHTQALASGSIAQVHYAKLMDGTPVVVKIMHPGVHKRIIEDTDILAVIWNYIPYMNQINFKEVKQRMIEQLDMRIEKQNLEEFVNRFSHLDSVHFPRPIWANTDILVETYEPGIPFGGFIKQNPCYVDRCIAMRLAVFYKMAFIDDFLHGDLHSGNILYSIRKGKLHISFLDAGVVSSILDKDALSKFLYGVFGIDLEKLTHILCQFNLNPRADLVQFQTCMDEFKQRLSTDASLSSLVDRSDDFKEYQNASMEINSATGSIVIKEILNYSRKCRLIFNGNVLYLLIGFLTADGNSTYYTDKNVHMLALSIIHEQKMANMLSIVGPLLYGHILKSREKRKDMEENYKEEKCLETVESLLNSLKIYIQTLKS